MEITVMMVVAVVLATMVGVMLVSNKDETSKEGNLMAKVFIAGLVLFLLARAAVFLLPDNFLA